MDFWRGEAYQAFFQHLESKGGFYYEVCPGLLVRIMFTFELKLDAASAGGMHPFTALRHRFLPEKIKYISSTI